ncbi:M20/M25/M40 family metallo-hydrolase [Thermosulfurimonas marina]|uniref:M20/M25/M40 family metallo-hydrolase n=1 Tax=Thermosulfurimonas marina TaxID=2047767 RepID=A0A6H1WR99_9BACT|nr:M20/M25/M40 family metallo-hydrolase [Thermosulfurimonas marina]QJA05666.1 M20/M25/M40 family metallo-hydrolase [Thermosulfurimonas marina]
MKERLRDLILKLASIRSESGREAEILAFIEGWLSARGLPTLRQEVPGCAPNLLVFFSQDPELLLTTHVDTVPPELGLYPPRAEGDQLYGLGVCDAKAGVALLMLLAEEFAGRSLPLALAFLVDEENEGRGSARLAEEYRFPSAVVLEPTHLTVAIAEGGSIEYEVEVRGRAVHGSLAFRGENAIERAMEVVSGLKRLPFLYEEHPMLGPSGFNVEKFMGGDGQLRVPDRVELEIEFRILPGQNLATIRQEIENYFRQFSWVSFRVKDISEAYSLSREARVVKLLSEAFERATGREAVLSGMPSWTDAAHLAAAGTEAVVFGPGDLALCHTPEETLSLSEAETAWRVLKELALSLS